MLLWLGDRAGFQGGVERRWFICFWLVGVEEWRRVGE